MEGLRGLASIIVMLHRSMEDSAAFAVTFVSSLVLILIVSFFVNKLVDEKGIRLTQLMYKLFDDKILRRFRHLIPPGIISGTPK